MIRSIRNIAMSFKDIGVVAAVFIISFAVLYCLMSIINPGYEAKAKIIASYGNLTGDENYRFSYNTMLVLLKSEMLMKDVVEELGEELPPDVNIQKMISSIDVRRIKGTDLIEVSMKSKDQAAAVMTVNTVCKKFVEKLNKNRFMFEEDFITWLRDKAVGLREDFEKTLADVRSYKEDMEGVDLNAEHESMQKNLNDIRAQLETLKSRKHEYEIQFGDYDKQLQSGASIEDLPILQNDPTYRQLVLELEAAEAQKESLLNTYQPGHPRISEISQRILTLKLNMSDLKQKLAGQIRGQGGDLDKQIKRLEDMAKSESDKLMSFENKLDEYNSLLDQLKEKEILYSSFLGSAETSMGNISFQNVDFIEPAALPFKKQFPSLKIVFMISICLTVIIMAVYGTIKYGIRG